MSSNISRPWAALLATTIFSSLGASAAPKRSQPSDAQVRKILIAESRAEYSGSCPCPYDTDRRGRHCGKRSAYSRPGGEAPLCFDHDVTQEMIEAYRARTNAE